MINRLIGSDFIFWLTVNTAHPLLLALFRVPRAVQARLSTEDRDILRQTLATMLPMSQRIQGLAIDQGFTFPRDFPLSWM